MSSHLVKLMADVWVGGCLGLSCCMAAADGTRQAHMEGWGSQADISSCFSVGLDSSQSQASHNTCTQPSKTTTPFNIMAKLGSRACQAYNKDGCSHAEQHLKGLHICAYFLAMVNHMCAHQEKFCYCKQYAVAKRHKGGKCSNAPAPPPPSGIFNDHGRFCQ